MRNVIARKLIEGTMNFLVSCFILSLVCCRCNSILFDSNGGNQSPVVTTDCGTLEGSFVTTEQVYVFRGIPYAEPPVNSLRWKPPIPVLKKHGNCWNGTYIARQFGNACKQRGSRDYSKNKGAEDCLYLNVWTPSLTPAAQLPVMFYIHGGDLLDSNGNEQNIGYAPTPKLAHDTNIVYVSINYRLNAFGFMALEWLKEKSQFNTSGNYGFMDMIAALQWVQQNIGNFGGDPNQVTVFGQSSGGTAIFALLASPLCQGLFHKAWLLSASPVMNKTAADAFKDNEIFIRNSNCSNVDCLYALSADEVIANIPWDVFPAWRMAGQQGLPNKGHFDGALAIIDGYVLKEAPFDAWVHGRGVDVPTIIGTNAQECDQHPVPHHSVSNWTWASGQYETQVRNTLGTFGDVIAETALRLYPHGSITPEYQYTTMTSDLRMTCGNDYLTLIAASSFTSPVYRYVTSYFPSQPAPLFLGEYHSRYSAHGIDMYAFFATMDTIVPKPTSADHQWESNVQKEIVEFVKNGKPSSKDWIPYPTTTALLSANTTVVDTYHAKECEFWLKNGFFSYSWIN